MRTLYTLFALLSLVLVSLVVSAAPPNPILNVDCSVVSLGVCAAATGVAFDGGGLNPHKSYAVEATLLEDPTQDFTDVLTVNSDGTFSDLGESFVNVGTWTFTLSILGHDGLPQKDLVVQTLSFQ